MLEDQLDQAYRAGVVIAVGGDDETWPLLRQVLAAPRDDEPRLAYAGAVQGDDPERAEFIRLQVSDSRLSRGQSGQLLGYSDRAFRLWNERGAQWARGIRTLATSWGYLRGFVGSVRMDAARFLASAPRLFRLAPVEHLHLTGVPEVAAELFASPYLQRIQALSLPDLTDNVIGPGGLEALAVSESLPSLGYLGFRGNKAADRHPVTRTITTATHWQPASSSTGTVTRTGWTRGRGRTGHPAPTRPHFFNGYPVPGTAAVTAAGCPGRAQPRCAARNSAVRPGRYRCR